MYRSSGNWVEDLAHDVDVWMKFGLAAVFIIPALLVIIGVLVIVLLVT